MTREEIIRSPEYWLTRVQVLLYNCALYRGYAVDYANCKADICRLAKDLGISERSVRKVLRSEYDGKLSEFIEILTKLGYKIEIKEITGNE